MQRIGPASHGTAHRSLSKRCPPPRGASALHICDEWQRSRRTKIWPTTRTRDAIPSCIAAHASQPLTDRLWRTRLAMVAAAAPCRHRWKPKPQRQPSRHAVCRCYRLQTPLGAACWQRAVVSFLHRCQCPTTRAPWRGVKYQHKHKHRQTHYREPTPGVIRRSRHGKELRTTVGLQTCEGVPTREQMANHQ